MLLRCLPRCKDCVLLLCDEHNASTHRGKSSSCHVRVSIELLASPNVPSTCSKAGHGKLSLTHYCEKDNCVLGMCW
jgi:hypothetical protein